jgi:hypothetical protein
LKWLLFPWLVGRLESLLVFEWQKDTNVFWLVDWQELVGALVAWGLLLSFQASAWTFLALPYFAYNFRTSGALHRTTAHFQDGLLAVLCHLPFMQIDGRYICSANTCIFHTFLSFSGMGCFPFFQSQQLSL